MKLVNKRRALVGRVTIVDSREVIKMEDKLATCRHENLTSMWSAIESVRDGKASVCVSCGNTGALIAISMLRLRKLTGVTVLQLIMASSNPMDSMLLDVGADIELRQRLTTICFDGSIIRQKRIGNKAKVGL